MPRTRSTTDPSLSWCEHELVTGLNDAERVERAYREHAPKLFRSLVAYSGDPEIAADALAEAFAQVLRRGPAVMEVDRWVWRSAFRIAAGALKERHARVPTSGGSYEMDDDAIVMVSLLRTLPRKQRAAIVLRYFSDLPNAQIAEILGITTATVRVHLSQGRRRLRRLLEDPDD